MESENAPYPPPCPSYNASKRCFAANLPSAVVVTRSPPPPLPEVLRPYPDAVDMQIGDVDAARGGGRGFGSTAELIPSAMGQREGPPRWRRRFMTPLMLNVLGRTCENWYESD